MNATATSSKPTVALSAAELEHLERAREHVRACAIAQGFPETITDPTILAKVAAVLKSR